MNENLKIHDYHGNQYLVNLEENRTDIWWAIRYVDHGDEFILVCTNDEKIFCYGWWKDRYHFGSPIRDHKLFAKKVPWGSNPFKKQKYPYLSTDLTWDIKYAMEHYTKSCDESCSNYFQGCFNNIIKNLILAYETGYLYDWTKYKKGVKKFLEVQKLDTEANLNAFENAPWTSLRIDGCIGIAAKEDWTKHGGFGCDSVKSVWHEGSWHDTTYEDRDWHSEPILYRNIPYEYDEPDQWGESSMMFVYKDIKNCLAQSVLF